MTKAILERDPVTGKIKRSAGRQPGSKESPKATLRRIARAEIDRQFGMLDTPKTLQKMVPEALKRLEAQLKAGDPATVLWFMDRMIDKGPLLQVIPNADLTTFAGVMDCARALMEGMVHGLIPMAQAERSIAILTNYTKLKATEEIKELRALLEAIEEQSNARSRNALTPTEQPLPPEQLPAWGNLRKGLPNGQDEGESPGD